MELNSNLAKLLIVQNQEQINIENSPEVSQSKEQPLSKLIFSPNNPPWNSGVAILTWFVSVLLIAIVPTVGVLAYLASSGINITDSAKMTTAIQTDPNALLINVIAVIPAHILTLLLAWLVVTYGRQYSFREMLGWESGGFKILHLLGIVVGFFALAAILSNFIPEQENDFLKMLRSSREIVFVVAFMATFSAPIVEEVIYRGVLYSAFQRTFGVPIAIGLVTLLFAAVHVPQYYPSFASIFMICLLSLVITLVRVKSNNLLPCIILHTIFNGIQSILLIAEPYLRQFTPENPQTSFFFLQ